MDSLQDLIVRNRNEFPEFEYYLPIIERAKQNQEDHPDIAIECCNSLIQGISKTIIFSSLSSFLKSLNRLRKVDIQKLIKNDSVHVQFSTALSILEKEVEDSVFFDLIDKAFHSLQNKEPNRSDANKIKLVFNEAIKISDEGKLEGEEIKFLKSCGELLNDQTTSFFTLVQNACFSLKRKPISNDAIFKEALKVLSDHGDILEIEFIKACQTLINKISNFRNDRGDISHGREVPKTLKSDVNLSRLIIEMTESLLRYTLAAFFVVDLERKAREFEAKELQKEEMRISYKKNLDFNELLDNEYPLDGKLLYSEALYTLYYEDYAIKLQTFFDEQELLDEE
jgi:uncharacterized protein involved in tolerance to divalent cations